MVSRVGVSFPLFHILSDICLLLKSSCLVFGSFVQGTHGMQSPLRPRSCVRFVLCAACSTENVALFNYCYACGVPPSRGLPVPRTPDASPVVIDVAKLQARRSQILAMMSGRRGQQRKCRVADEFDAFLLSYSDGRRGWAEATPDDVFDFCCFRDSQGGGTKWVHAASCPGVGLAHGKNCAPGSSCAKRYAAASMQKGVVSKLKLAMKELLGKGEEWDPLRRSGNPCSSPLVDAYLTSTGVEQRKVGVVVNQAEAMLTDTLVQLLRDMRARAQVAPALATRISLTRDIALYTLAFASMRRGYDLSFTLGSQILRLPESRGLIFNFHFGKTLRESAEAVVVRPDSQCPAVCALRGVTAYISAAERLGWDLTTGHFFPVVAADGRRDIVPLTAVQMTTSLQAHLRAAGLPAHFTMHSFRVGGSLTQSLGGTAVDEIMKIAGWKTQSVAERYIGPTTSGTVAASKRQRSRGYEDSNKRPLLDAFTHDFAACAKN